MHRPTLPALLAAACLAAPIAAANDKLEEVIVTSSRVQMPLRHLGTSVSVVTGRDILARGYTSLTDVLRLEPAISVTNTGGQGKATSLRVRGESGFRTRVLMDGIDITDVSSPQAGPRMEHLVSAGVERVEILRGPQGLMYGADAGGVVAVTTRRASSDFEGGFAGELGRYDTQQLGAHLGGDNGTLDYGLFANRFETDGFNSRTTDTVLRDNDGYENTTLHGRLGWQLTEQWRADLVAHRIDGESEYDDCSTVDTFAPTDDCDDEYDQGAWRAQLERRGEQFSHTLAYNESETERTFYSEGVESFALDGELRRIEYIGGWDGPEQLKLVYGAELLRESMDDGSIDPERDQQGYYLEYQGEVADDLFLTAGMRYDDNDDFGTHTTYRVSAAYVLELASADLKFKGTWGTGFRAPSLYEIAYNAGPFALPPASNTRLDVEESEGFDLGVAWYASAGWHVELVYFDQQIEDEIFFDLIDFSGYLQGDGDSHSRGVELIGEWPVGRGLSLSGNYTYNDTEDAEGFPRLRVPEQLANIVLDYRPGDGRLAIHLALRAARDATEALGVELDDYEVLDLGASYRVLDSLELYGRVENLTDEEYQQVPTYNSAGTAAYAGLRYNF
jgi:vitamin B12 transporter